MFLTIKRTCRSRSVMSRFRASVRGALDRATSGDKDMRIFLRADKWSPTAS
jgi:hypothetical protein